MLIDEAMTKAGQRRNSLNQQSGRIPGSNPPLERE